MIPDKTDSIQEFLKRSVKKLTKQFFIAFKPATFPAGWATSEIVAFQDLVIRFYERTEKIVI